MQTSDDHQECFLAYNTRDVKLKDIDNMNLLITCNVLHKATSTVRQNTVGSIFTWTLSYWQLVYAGVLSRKCLKNMLF